MIALYGDPDRDLLRNSSGTVWSCRHLGDSGVMVVDAKEISAVVAMVPHPTHTLGEDWRGWMFVVEKPGLDVAEMGGQMQDFEEDDNGEIGDEE